MDPQNETESGSGKSYDTLRIQISKVSAISEIGSKFSKAVSVNHLLSLVVKDTLDLMDADVCIIWLKDDKGNLIPRISFGMTTKIIETTRIRIGSSIAQCIFDKDEPTNVYDVTKKQTLLVRTIIKKENIKSLLAAPLIVEGEKMGVLMILTKHPRRFKGSDTRMFNAITKQAGLAIANIGLYEMMDKKVKEKVKEMSALFSMSRSISASLDLDTLLDLILEKVNTLMGADFCVLKLTDNRRRKLKIVSSAGLEKCDAGKLSKIEEERSKYVMRSGAPFVISDVPSYFHNKIPEYLRSRGIKSLIAVPLFSGRRKIGVLSAYLAKPKIFAKEDIEMFEMVSSLCSMAIDNSGMLERIRKDYLNTIKTLAKVIDANDSYTRGHCDKVMKYSLLICRRLKLPEGETNNIKIASLLHDIGKLGIDLNIIHKPGRLSDEDWKKVKAHPDIGAKIVGQVGFLQDVVPIIRYHHSKYDGGGYPDPDRSGNRIPIGSRIISVADAFDAMTSDRPYRKAMAREEALAELRRCAGTQFDPEVVEAFAEK